jgi:hypothetical protein
VQVGIAIGGTIFYIVTVLAKNLSVQTAQSLTLVTRGGQMPAVLPTNETIRDSESFVLLIGETGKVSFKHTAAVPRTDEPRRAL